MRHSFFFTLLTLTMSACAVWAGHAQPIPADGYAESDKHMLANGYTVLTTTDQKAAAFGQDIRRVYVTGSGPRVILLHEMPGLRPEDVDLGRRLGEQFQVYVPLLFGVAGQDDNRLGYAQACNSTPTLFDCNATNASHRITRSLHDLVTHVCADDDCGIVGMCLTGSMPLWLLPDPHVVAIVMAQPSLPFLHPIWPLPSRFDASEADIDKAMTVAGERSASIYITRYRGDLISSHRTFQRLVADIGSKAKAKKVTFKSLELDGRGHSTLVHDEHHAAQSEQEFQELVGALRVRLPRKTS